MRYPVVVVALALGACAQQPQQSGAQSSLATTYELYKQCLAALPPEQCETPKARFEAARAYADSESRRDAARAAARPPVVLQTYTPPAPVQMPRQPIACTTFGNTIMCN